MITRLSACTKSGVVRKMVLSPRETIRTVLNDPAQSPWGIYYDGRAIEALRKYPDRYSPDIARTFVDEWINRLDDPLAQQTARAYLDEIREERIKWMNDFL